MTTNIQTAGRSSDLPPLRVWLYCDPFGSQLLEKEPADEYEEIEAFLREALPCRTLNFKRDVLPTELRNGRPDIYLYDIGGLCYTDYSGVQRSNLSAVIVTEAREHSSTLFVPWTAMTRDYLRGAVLTLLPESEDEPNFVSPFNITCSDKDVDRSDWSNKTFRDIVTARLKEWFL